MSRVTAIFMFLAWLLYGAMPAMAVPSMPMAQQTTATQDHSRHHGQGKTVETVETAKAMHSHGEAQKPCPHGGKTCAMPFCAACLTLLPEIAASHDGPPGYAYPAPAMERALVAPAPAPLTPPPRA
ncbi:hypothetical protein ACFFP0_16505 [Rhizobium puerariae]|uniref:DUF2946 domain-containing protein n=1 Tax=Rhizobium puerariae TaxID=1585791 RepID=A0ABV6AIN3_9HYPH